MNLSPRWVHWLGEHGFEATHWTSVGPSNAPDVEVLSWAHTHDCLVFTHDLDFGAILAARGLNGPSVVQVRGEDVLPEAIGATIVAALHEFQRELTQGAMMTIDVRRARVRLLPLR